jgi:hypothetical protein
MVDHMKVPLHAGTAKPKGMEPSGRELTAYRIDRNEGNTEAGHHRLLDRLRMVQLHRRLEADPGSLQRPLGDATRGGPFLSHQEGFTGKCLGCNVPAPCPRMARRNDEEQLIGEANGQAFFARADGVAPHDAEIQFSRFDTVLDDARVSNLQP